jgi:outer membrane protein assembly factor BamD
MTERFLSWTLLARLLVVPLFLALSSCTTDEEEDVAYVERPVDTIYNEAMEALKGQRYGIAAGMFDEVERQHPYSAWATKAQIMAAYSHYLDNAYDDAVIALDRFIQLHPSSRDVPYAYYLKSLSYYEQISDVGRDQKMTQLAMKTLKELVARFPGSKYAADAKVKIDLTRDHLAGKEMNIGRYYQKKGHYMAAINRFKMVIARYQTTTHVPEALHRLAESFYALGIDEEAKKAVAVLGHNFPGSVWYMDSYKLVDKDVLLSVSQEKTEGEPWYQFW